MADYSGLCCAPDPAEWGLSKPVGPMVDRGAIQSVSVNLLQAGTSGRRADREVSEWTSGMVLKTIDEKSGVSREGMEPERLCSVSSVPYEESRPVIL